MRLLLAQLTHRRGEAHLVANPWYPDNRPNTPEGKGEEVERAGESEAESE